VVTITSLSHSLDGRGKGVSLLKESSNRKRKRNEIEEVKGEEL
jgi:hypothetical protein